MPRNDPTLLFTSAGMVQFKGVFTGVEKRPYQRAVTAQKCLRAGGKHNDLENVGYTARHHTFFEMLGNFSFGDYFKERAIELAWRLVTKEYGLAKERLTATVYADDDDAYALWRKIAGLPESRVIRIPTSDNFWAMGDTGPCGPCSEIFYDHGPEIAGGPPGSAEAEGDRFVEIWNLVFMQFDQPEPGKRVPLPRPSIDTGMGLERLAAVLQGKHDNYDIDLMRGLIEASAEASGTPPDGPHAVSHRVIADHLRASVFLIADGLLPSNEGRGYVLRRIMRRAMRHAQMLGCKEPLLWRLVPALVERMGAAYPELIRAQPLASETLLLEETRFKDTLGRGLRLLEEATASLPKEAPLPGEVAFKLYDTYGFPLDLTEDVLRAEGRKVDHAGFDAAMERQRAEARKAWAGSGEAATERVWFELREKCGASEFLGYTTTVAEGQVQAILVDSKPVARADAGAKVAVVVNQTPFYGELGGQMGDSGVIFAPDGLELAVSDTRAQGGRSHRAYGRGQEGPHRRRPGGRTPGRCRPARPAARQPFGDPSPAPGAAPNARRARDAEGLARGPRAPALRLQPSQTDDDGRARRGRGRGQCARAPEQRGGDPAHDARGRGRAGCPCAFRREIRRGGARRLDGRRTTVRASRPSSAAARTCAARATSAPSRSRASRPSPRACAASRP